MNLFNVANLAPEQIRLLVDDTESFLRQIWTPKDSKIQFQAEGVIFQATYQYREGACTLHLWSELGNLPYSVESVERRRMLIAILESARYLKGAQFGLTKEHQIVVAQTYKLRDLEPPSFIFPPLISFLQQARPFIKLIGECL